MSKILLYAILLFSTAAVSAQSVHRLADSASTQISAYAILPDHGYTLDQVRTDTTLRFILSDSLRPASVSYYWLRLIVANLSPYDEAYNLSVQPSLDNTLYYFDANNQHWLAHQAGIYAPYTGRRNTSILPFIAVGKAETTLYVKVDVHSLRQFDQVLKPVITVEKQAVTNDYEQFMLITWVATLSVMFLFFLNNLFIYVNFRDKIVLYYLITQVGGMIYVTNYIHFFQALFPCPVFTIGLLPTGQLLHFDVGNVLQHISILLMLYGQVQLTRTYLNTKKTLPHLDNILKYSLYTYMVASSTLLVINVFIVYVEYYTLSYHNVFALFLIGCVIGAGVVGYVRKLPAASPFLLATILPLAFMLATVTSHIFFSLYHVERSLLPDLGAISQALAFSVALVARTKSIQNELIARTVETERLGFDMREMKLKHRLTELENQKINADIRHEKTRNELLQERLDINQRELASTTLYIVQKNELLADLKAQLMRLSKHYPGLNQQRLKGIESILQSNLYLDGDWEKFKVHFEQVHPDFFENLLAKHPSLTKYEIRLYAYFHINLSTKEIAALLNIDPASVRRSKTRLYKKMAVAEPEDLLTYTQ